MIDRLSRYAPLAPIPGMKRLRTLLILAGLAIPAIAFAAAGDGSTPSGSCCPGACCPKCPLCPGMR